MVLLLHGDGVIMLLTRRIRKIVLPVIGSGCAAGIAVLSEQFTFLGILLCTLITGFVLFTANTNKEDIPIKE